MHIAGLNLRNPTMLAAGILGMTGLSLRKVWNAGAGAVVTKSISFQPRLGYKNPTIVDVGYGFLNAMGIPNPGVYEYVEEAKIAISEGELVIIVSLYGNTPLEFAKMARIVETAGVNAVELNLSCPHVKLGGMEIGTNPTIIDKIVKTVKKHINIPVFTKLTPNISDIKTIARAAEDAGSDGIVAINTVKAMAIDVESGRPLLANKYGGLSGPAIKPIALRCVYEIAQSVNIPVIGCGGITDWKDAIEFFLAGASAIQIGTAIAYKDVNIFGEIIKGIKCYLKRKGYNNIKEIVGLSHT
ncbi:MAG: dihydroorotate dehydrogenase [Candidatus Bathyarchaeota archaeon]|nr:MAG: dihydroorotate dehydrogenase [Candidatus Bathyarchaeota archaeon]